MRLTLRTMLAYLDDILEPDDTEDIGKKIEESEFASNLVHRTRDVMRQLRLGVPPLEGRGLAADPNSVAEYLDNTLAADRVPEFEKICLESNVHLAEVAACHQILTLVLGEPAEIEPRSRQRMYQLASHVDAPPIQSDAMRPATQPVLAGSGAPATRRAKPEVPDYLRESRSRFWPLAATILVAALLTCGALAVLGPAEWRERAIALVTGGSEPTNAEQDSNAAPEATSSDANSTDAAAQPTPVANSEPASDEAVAGDAAQTDAVQVDTAPGEVMPAEAGDSSVAETENTAEGAAGDSDATPEGAALDKNGAKVARSLPREPGLERMPAAADKSDTPPPLDLPDAPLPLPPGEKGDLPDAAAGDNAPEPAAPANENFGRYTSSTSKHEVLLRFDAAKAEWKRLPAMSPLVKGDKLLALPLFRPMITLSSNITIQSDGASLIDLVGWTDLGVPIINVEYGRLTMMTIGKAANALQLKLGEKQLTLTFVDAESTAALEVRRALPAGQDPTASPAPMVADLYAVSGLIRIGDKDAPVELQAPAERSLFAGGEQPPGREFPKWVTSEAPSGADRLATTALEPLLTPDKPLGLILKEQAEDRRREVRLLAARSAAYLGDFEACARALNDPREKPWVVYFDELRSAIARSPDTAVQVRAAFDKQRAADAPLLFRMLWGYTPDDLKSGADRDLIDGLQNVDSLDFRVLAYLNLIAIAGPANHGYHPEETAKQRARAVTAWKGVLAKMREGKSAPRAPQTPAKSKAAKADQATSS